MKKLISFLLLLLVYSCNIEDPAKPLEVNLDRTATISGVALIVQDEHLQIWAPAPIRRADFFVTVAYNQLVTEANGFYVLPVERISYNATTGVFTITVPAGVVETHVSVTINGFPGHVNRTNPGGDHLPPVRQNVQWKMQNEIVKVSPGGTANHSFLWNGNYDEVYGPGDNSN